MYLFMELLKWTIKTHKQQDQRTWKIKSQAYKWKGDEWVKYWGTGNQMQIGLTYLTSVVLNALVYPVS